MKTLNVLFEVFLYLQPYLILALFIDAKAWAAYMVIPLIPLVHCGLTELGIWLGIYHVE